MKAPEIIAKLGLAEHPEGGWYRQTWVADNLDGGRPAGTAIYYLLEAGERSHWHRVDADEIWHFYAGAPLHLLQAAQDDGPVSRSVLGPDLAAGEHPQVIVPMGHWQSAETTLGWTLVGCTVSPGFQFEGFELAADGWCPGD